MAFVADFWTSRGGMSLELFAICKSSGLRGAELEETVPHRRDPAGSERDVTMCNPRSLACAGTC